MTHRAGRRCYWLQALAASAYLLEAVALATSPASGHFRRLLSWRHGVVLVLTAAAIQALTLLSDASSPFAATGKLLSSTADSSQ